MRRNSNNSTELKPVVVRGAAATAASAAETHIVGNDDDAAATDHSETAALVGDSSRSAADSSAAAPASTSAVIDDGLNPPPLPVDTDALKVPNSLASLLTVKGLWQVVMRRTGLLVSLLLLQSLSQFILEFYEHLISYHIVVPLFLTMLVGAGGNAGNQAAVRVIAGLVTGQLTVADTWQVLKSEILIGLINGLILAGIGFTRVYWLYEEGTGLFWSALAITLSLFCIVITSAVLGTLLPFLLEYVGIDREHAAPAIQVIMDICGVLITCVVCTMIIPESEHQTSHHHGSTTTTTTSAAAKAAFGQGGVLPVVTPSP